MIWLNQKFEPPVLDIGIGDGRNSKLLFVSQEKIDVGIDIDPNGVKIARTSGMYKKVVVADAAKMPFEDKSFKTIISNSTFEHIKEDTLAVKEVSRVLLPGGNFLFTVPSLRLVRFLKEIGVTNKELDWYNRRVAHFHYHSLEEWREILSNHQLKIIHFNFYFPKKVVKVWYHLFKLATFKLYHRELWSYLKDSPYGKLVPAFLIKFFLKKFLRPYLKQVFSKEGSWVFIVARKFK